jgi:hypothetical protein
MADKTDDEECFDHRGAPDWPRFTNGFCPMCLHNRLSFLGEQLKMVRGLTSVNYEGLPVASYQGALFDIRVIVDLAIASVPISARTPIPIVTHCPAGHQHVDEGEWATKLHKTHQCQFVLDEGGENQRVCGKEWRPMNAPTVGVKSL